MNNLVTEFNDYRSKMNEKLLADNNKVIKRIFNLDTNTYAEGALDVRTKELLGLVASAVLRCDDCIKYHLETAYKLGVTKEEMMEHSKNSPFVKQAKKNLLEFNIKRDGRKLTSTDVIRIKKTLARIDQPTRIKMIAKQFGVSEMQIRRIKSGENWGHIKI